MGTGISKTLLCLLTEEKEERVCYKWKYFRRHVAFHRSPTPALLLFLYVIYILQNCPNYAHVQTLLHFPFVLCWIWAKSSVWKYMQEKVFIIITRLLGLSPCLFVLKVFYIFRDKNMFIAIGNLTKSVERDFFLLCFPSNSIDAAFSCSWQSIVLFFLLMGESET